MTVVTADPSRPICAFCTFREHYSLALLPIPFPSLAKISLQCWLNPYLLLNLEAVQPPGGCDSSLSSRNTFIYPRDFLKGKELKMSLKVLDSSAFFQQLFIPEWVLVLEGSDLHMTRGFVLTVKKKKKECLHLFRENTADLHCNSFEVFEKLHLLWVWQSHTGSLLQECLPQFWDLQNRKFLPRVVWRQMLTSSKGMTGGKVANKWGLLYIKSLPVEVLGARERISRVMWLEMVNTREWETSRTGKSWGTELNFQEGPMILCAFKIVKFQCLKKGLLCAQGTKLFKNHIYKISEGKHPEISSYTWKLGPVLLSMKAKRKLKAL